MRPRSTIWSPHAELPLLCSAALSRAGGSTREILAGLVGVVIYSMPVLSPRGGVVLQAARLGQQKLRRIVPLLAALPVRTSHYSSNHHSPAGLVLNNTPGQKKDVIEIHVLAITAALSMRTRLKNTTPPFREGHCMRGAAGAINRRAYPIFLLPSTT
jgi:hypothetical protein